MPNIAIGSASYPFIANTRHHTSTTDLLVNADGDVGTIERASVICPQLTLTNDGASWTMNDAVVHISGGTIFNLTGGQLDMEDTVIVTNGSRFGGSRPSRQGNGLSGTWRNVIIQSIRSAGTATNLGTEDIDGDGLTLDRVSFVGNAVLQVVPGKLFLTVDFGSGVVQNRNLRIVNGWVLTTTPSMRNTWTLMWDCDLSGFNAPRGIEWHGQGVNASNEG